jgi:hypothetical protein
MRSLRYRLLSFFSFFFKKKETGRGVRHFFNAVRSHLARNENIEAKFEIEPENDVATTFEHFARRLLFFFKRSFLSRSIFIISIVRVFFF